MQRWFTPMLCSLAVALLGAGVPIPTNTPSLVVFTLVSSGSVSVESSARIAAAIGVRIETAGGIAVKSAPPDVKQADFLDVARKLGVDYYVSGFVGPLGGGYSAALQLVGTSNGVPVWTGTATLSGTDDVSEIADALQTVIRNRASRYAALPESTPPPAPAPAPPPARAPLPAPVERATAAPVAQAPGPPVNVDAATVAVLNAVATGSGTTAAQLAYTSDAIATLLEKRGTVATRWHGQAPNIALGGALLCEETKTGSLLEPSVKTDSTSGNDTGGGNWSNVTVQLVSFDCLTHQVSRVVSGVNGAFNWVWAADRSIADVGARLPLPKPAGAR